MQYHNENNRYLSHILIKYRTMRNKSIVSITTIASTTEVFVLDSMIDMQREGWDVTLMCNMDSKLREKIPEGMSYVDVPMERTFNAIKAVKCVLQIIREMRKIRPAVVQYGTTHAALFGSIAAWWTHVPVRVHLQWGLYNYNEMGLVGKLYWFIEWLTCKLSTHIRPVSNKNCQAAIDQKLFKPGKGAVLGEGGTIGIDLSKYQLADKVGYREKIRRKYCIDNSAFLYGFIGRLSKDKGNNELFEAFKNLCQNRNVSLLLVGADEGTVDSALLQWAKECPQVVFAGRVSHDEIPQYISAMDVLVHPTYREGFGMVLQEAMAMEVPIITTDIPGPSEVIESNVSGTLVPAKDAQSLYEAMLKSYEMPELYQEYGKNGRHRVEKCFNRPIMVRQIRMDKETLYSEYCNQKKC